GAGGRNRPQLIVPVERHVTAAYSVAARRERAGRASRRLRELALVEPGGNVGEIEVALEPAGHEAERDPAHRLEPTDRDAEVICERDGLREHREHVRIAWHERAFSRDDVGRG